MNEFEMALERIRPTIGGIATVNPHWLRFFRVVRSLSASLDEQGTPHEEKRSGDEE